MKAVDLIKAHEGLRLVAYHDNDGSLTIGYGQHFDSLTLDQRARLTAEYGSVADAALHIRYETANWMIEERAAALEAWATVSIAGFSLLDETRQAVLIDMAYELGEGRPGKSGLLGFPHFLHAVEQGDWKQAVVEMDSSHWAKQVPAREQNDRALLLEAA